MRVGIIGAGFGGLAASYYLSKKGCEVLVFEAGDQPGGLAVGFKKKEWKWSIEKHYHHLFTNDYSILNLAQEIGYPVVRIRPKTCSFVDGKIIQLDSVESLLRFPKLSFLEKLRMGAVLAFLKATPFWKPLERITAEEFIKRYMGEKAWKILWGPLFVGKFHEFSGKIPASWFWARIKKRTEFLVYPYGGFLAFAKAIEKSVKDYKGKFFYNTEVFSISLVRSSGKLVIKTPRGNFEFEKVICTLPTPLFLKITKGLSKEYVKSIVGLKGLGSVNLLLSLSKKFLEDGTYWLNITDSHFPFIAVIEHTNFIDKRYYNTEHLVYVGNYLPHHHIFFRKEANELLSDFYPYLKKINPKFEKSWVGSAFVFKAFFTQPIIPLNYSKKIPRFETPIKGLYLCNIQQVYPWDRGTNYAVENAKKVSELVLQGKIRE